VHFAVPAESICRAFGFFPETVSYYKYPTESSYLNRHTQSAVEYGMGKYPVGKPSALVLIRMILPHEIFA
jgi:hypothetical protein